MQLEDNRGWCRREARRKAETEKTLKTYWDAEKTSMNRRVQGIDDVDRFGKRHGEDAKKKFYE